MKNRKARPASRNIRGTITPRRTGAAARKPTPTVRRTTSVARRTSTVSNMRQRSARQDAIRRQTRQTQRVRPAVRPAAAPRRVMPKAPAPPAVRSVPAQSRIRRAVRPVSRPGSKPPVRSAAKPPAPRAGRRESSGVGAALGGAAVVTAAAFALNASRAHPDIAPEVTALQYSLSNLQNLSSYDDLRADLNELDTEINHALNLLESARDQGYRYQKDLEDLARKTASAWHAVRDEVMAAVEQDAAAMQSTLAPLNNQVSTLNARLGQASTASPYLRSTETAVNGYLADVNTSRREIQARYAEIESNAYHLTSRLTTIHWMLGQLSESRWAPVSGEYLVSAVKCRWDREGDDDPEGILFLSTKRMAFERKEKVATKKILFITTEKELVQEVLFDEAVANIKSSKPQSKGLFGHQDYLEVQFGGSLGTLSLHIEGQDSADWANLIERVKSGKIEEDRAQEGGLSFKDLTGDITQADILAIQAEVNALQDELMLAVPRAELEDLENNMRELERDLGALRARGYAVEKGLEGDVVVLASQWDRVKENANKTIDMQAGALGELSRSMTESMGKLAGMSANLAAARPLYMQLKSSIASAEAQSAAALETIYGQFEDYAGEVEGLAAHFDWIDWMLDALSTASFQLLATESGVAAVEATYARPGMEEENGILFLTDQRVIWEDRVGDYEVKIDEPLTHVEKVSVELLDEEDEILVFRFGGGAALHEAQLDIAAEVGEEWVQMVGRARNGDYSTDRAVEIDPAELEKIKNAPTQCSNCGGQFTAPILRGQTDVTCEFCGVVTRL